MNRSIWNVIIGGFSATGAATGAGADKDQSVQSVQAVDVAILLNYSSKVILVAGIWNGRSTGPKTGQRAGRIIDG